MIAAGEDCYSMALQVAKHLVTNHGRFVDHYEAVPPIERRTCAPAFELLSLFIDKGRIEQPMECPTERDSLFTLFEEEPRKLSVELTWRRCLLTIARHDILVGELAAKDR